jgi:cytosine/adenosine deaminase-related metal-dependent hydrolase
MSILLTNATYIDWTTLEFSQKNILIEEKNNAIQFIDNIALSVKKPDIEVVNCVGKLVTRSFAVGHHHAYSALSRGMCAPQKY